MLRAGRERVAVCVYPSVLVSASIRPHVCVCVCVRLRPTWKASTEGQVRGSPRMMRLENQKHMGMEGRGRREGGK
jgi:hypothetical protein